MAAPEGYTAGRGVLRTMGRAWWGIWPRRSCDQSEVETNVCSATEKVKSRAWVQVWIWRHALPRLGQLEVVSLGACMYCGSILVLTCSGAGRGSIAARLGQEGLILKQRIAVADPTRADAHLDWALRASLARPKEVQLLWRWVWLRSQDPRHLPDAV